MKPGITQICLPRRNLYADLDFARDTGYEAIELVFSDEGEPSIDASADELAQVKSACDSRGLEIVSIRPLRQDGGSLLSPDAAERDKLVNILSRGLEIAESLGVDGLLLHPGSLEPGVSYIKTWNNFRDALKTLAPEAESRGCSIGVENVWNKFILSPLEACRFVDEVGSSAVGIYIDVANMILYGYPEMWIHDLGSRITKVHVKDFRRRDHAWVQLMDGDVDWPAVMRELRNIGFDGALVSEVGGDAAMARETAERIAKIRNM
ncbi:MAG: sugar phosphate isomerase/epimerase [Candidatus Latescibacteria bacterium]|jgi:L-ribulose-5-phosphate 3-epimerase|nr:sugar phosphate isomerase/epimerase [Candidatus Latescibacterota bacterium]